MDTSPLIDPYRHHHFPAELNEEFLTLRGERHYLWRAVDQEGNVLDISVQHRRD
jgi:transposase-like protein